MSKVPIGRIGKILSGGDTGKFVKVVDDTNNTGGFLVLVSKDPSCTTWFDSWVANEDDLKSYVRASNWMIEWKA